MRAKTLHVLEYDKIIEMLKNQASSEMTRRVISELQPVSDARQIREKQQETTEAVRLITAKGPLPVGGFYDIEGIVSFARKGGVLQRTGHTEAVVDLAKLCGHTPAGAMCEIMTPDGHMARRDYLREFANKHYIKFISVAELIA